MVIPMCGSEGLMSVGVVIAVPKPGKKVVSPFVKPVFFKNVPDTVKDYFHTTTTEIPDVDKFLKDRGLPQNYKGISIRHQGILVRFDDYFIVVDHNIKLPKKKIKGFIPDSEKVLFLIPFPIWDYMDRENIKFKEFKNKKSLVEFCNHTIRFIAPTLAPMDIPRLLGNVLRGNKLLFRNVKVYYFKVKTSDIYY